MVHHIVMWKFKAEIPEERKPELKAAMKENLNSLVGKVPGLLEMKFVDEPLSSSTHDIALVSVLEKAEDIVRVRDYVEQVLSPREKEIIIRRYGLDGTAPVTQKKVGGDMGISRSYVSRIEKKALGKLKKAFDNTYI